MTPNWAVLARRPGEPRLLRRTSPGPTPAHVYPRVGAPLPSSPAQSPAQEVDAPAGQRHVQPVAADRVTVAAKRSPVRTSTSMSGPPSMPGGRTRPSALLVRQVDDDEVGRVRRRPRPRDEVLARAVVRPAVDLDQRPLAAAHAAAEGRQQAVVPARRSASSGSSGRRPSVTGTRTRRPSDCPSWSSATPGRVRATAAAARSRAAPARRASRGSSWFSTKRTVCAWYAGSAREVVADRRRRLAVDEPVVEALVVAGVEALLDEHRLEVPVRLGPEHEVGVGGAHRADHGRPVPAPAVRRRPASARSPQVRANTSSSTSIAMSQRTPSHRSAIDRDDARPPPPATPAARRRAARPRATAGSTGRGRGR